MPTSDDHKLNDFAKYDTMSTEALQQILRDDASNPEGNESDMDMLLHVMDVLAKRRQANNEGKSPEEALETFKKKYYLEYDLSFTSESRSDPRRKRYSIPMVKGLIAAMVAIVIFIGATFTASATGFDIWEIIGKWTKETFHFGYAGQDTEVEAPSSEYLYPCASLQDALDKRNITTELVPKWLPEGYTESNVEITQTPKQRLFVATFNNSDQRVRIRIADYLDSYPMQIEQNDSLIDIYQVNGISYYIFDNSGLLQAVWHNQNYECFISGPLSLSELKEMIDSIE